MSVVPRAVPRGMAAHALYGTDHISGWHIVLFWVIMFTVAMALILFW